VKDCNGFNNELHTVLITQESVAITMKRNEDAVGLLLLLLLDSIDGSGIDRSCEIANEIVVFAAKNSYTEASNPNPILPIFQTDNKIWSGSFDSESFASEGQ
jgi:hypothetical protein